MCEGFGRWTGFVTGGDVLEIAFSNPALKSPEESKGANSFSEAKEIRGAFHSSSHYCAFLEMAQTEANHGPEAKGSIWI